MAKRFQFTVDHMIGRREVELVVTYSMTPGRPGTGPSYACGGEPAEDAEVEIILIKHNGQPVTLTDAEEDAMLEQAIERSADDWDIDESDAAEWHEQSRRDDMLMDQWERDE